MAPRIRVGDVVVAMPVDTATLRIGQVLLVDDPDHEGQSRLHRMVGADETGALVLKGDANPTVDSSSVARDAVRGIGVIRVPFVGLPGLWLRDRAIFPLILLVGALGGLLLATRLDRRALHHVDSDAGPMSPPSDDPPPVSAGGACEVVSARSRRALMVTALAVVALTIFSIGGVTANAAFSGKAANPGNSLQADATYPCLTPTPAAPADSPYLLYRFTETSGSIANDSSGNNRNGTIRGSAVRAPGSCIANASPALALDGVNDYVSTASSTPGPNVFSLEIWFKTVSGYGQGGKLIGFGNSQLGQSTSYDRHIYMNPAGKLLFGVSSNGAKTIISPLSYNTGTWTHVVATLSPAGMRLYVDGALVAFDATITTAQAYNGFWKIGYDNLTGWTTPPPRFFFQGTIDNPAVYTAALTDTQITAHGNTGH